eukprot:scaffold2712_cov161-Prasinococcus_capsulatus_cf.AAC.1
MISNRQSLAYAEGEVSFLTCQEGAWFRNRQHHRAGYVRGGRYEVCSRATRHSAARCESLGRQSACSYAGPGSLLRCPLRYASCPLIAVARLQLTSGDAKLITTV